MNENYFSLQPFLLRLSLPLLAAVLTCNAFGQTLTTIHSFSTGPRDGAAGGSGVVIDRNGNVFGATGVGGEPGDGVVYELTPPATAGGPWAETILHQFRGTPDGKIPLSRLTMLPSGALIGTTLRGGANDSGTAYAVVPGKSGGTEMILHDFGGGPDSIFSPTLGFLAAPEGLYAADAGGANGTGAVYLLTPPLTGTSWTLRILYSFGPFQSGDAFGASGELVRDSNGNLFGLSAQGGANNLGAVYEVSPPTAPGKPWTEQILHSFNGTDGTLPAGRLLLGEHGRLFGVTGGGGTHDAGTVFELTPPAVAGRAWTHSIIYSFTGGADGTSPENGVITDGTGRLFGSAGDAIFMLTPVNSGWKETVLHNFTGPDGFSAITPLTLFNNALYGTTIQAGPLGSGTVFQLTLP